MDIFGPSLQSAVLASHARLEARAKDAAGIGGPSAETAMAESAQEALFNEALLGAAKAHIEEIKTVSK